MRTGNADRGKNGKIASDAIVRQFQTILLCIRENLQFSRKFHKFRNCQNQAKSGIMEPSKTALKRFVRRPNMAAIYLYKRSIYNVLQSITEPHRNGLQVIVPLSYSKRTGGTDNI